MHLHPPKTECVCPSGGGILKNGHIRYPSYGVEERRKKKRKKKSVIRSDSSERVAKRQFGHSELLTYVSLVELMYVVFIACQVELSQATRVSVVVGLLSMSHMADVNCSSAITDLPLFVDF